MAGQTILYLVDTSFNTNLVSKWVFDRLTKRIQDKLINCDTHEQIVDGTTLSFYEVLQMPSSIQDVKLEELFVVSQINKKTLSGHAIFGYKRLKNKFHSAFRNY